MEFLKMVLSISLITFKKNHYNIKITLGVKQSCHPYERTQKHVNFPPLLDKSLLINEFK